MVKLLILIIFSSNLYSAKIHPDAGETSASFLKVPVGTRASAMGGGYTSIKGDIYSAFYNPAGSFDSGRIFSFMHNMHFADIRQYVAVYGFSPSLTKDRRDYISFSLNYLTYGELDGRSGLYEYDPYAPSPVEGRFKASDVSFMVNYSFEIHNAVAGLNLKYINQSIEDESGSVLAFDAGFIKRVKIKDRYFNLGFSLFNIGKDLRLVSKGYPLPFAFKGGISTNYNDSVVTVDFTIWRDNYPFIMLGYEKNISSNLYLRIGYRYRIYGNELGFWSGFSTGFGFEYTNFSFGYSLSSYGDIGYSHKIELGIRY